MLFTPTEAQKPLLKNLSDLEDFLKANPDRYVDGESGNFKKIWIWDLIEGAGLIYLSFSFDERHQIIDEIKDNFLVLNQETRKKFFPDEDSQKIFSELTQFLLPTFSECEVVHKKP